MLNIQSQEKTVASVPVLRVAGLKKEYATAVGPLTVLKEVSFDLDAGASLAIVGPSGRVKTPLLGRCAGLDHPSGGTVSLPEVPSGD